MKKIVLAFFLLLALTSCIGDSDDVKKAKQEMGVIERDEGVEVELEKEVEKEDIVLSGDPRIQITQILGDTVLELDELKYADFKNGYSKISGNVLGNVDKIKVTFSNEESEFPDDVFTLQKFKKGDSSFEYNASSRFKVLDFGVNKYIFTAYSGDQISELELLVLVSENDDKFLISPEKEETLLNKIEREESSSKELIGGEDDMVFTDFPTGGDFGDIVKLGESSFTYSDIKGFEIKKESVGTVDCSRDEETEEYMVTSYIRENIGSWFYWNTCRSIIKENGIHFFVTRLEKNEYVYEKHYLDNKHGLHGVYELERGELYSLEDTLETKEKDELLGAKNKELKEKNAEFEQQAVTDSLFKKITQ